MSDEMKEHLLVGGPANQASIRLPEPPPFALDIGGHRYHRVKDPDTGEALGLYVYTTSTARLIEPTRPVSERPRPRAPQPDPKSRWRDRVADRLFCTRCLHTRAHPFHWLWCRTLGDW